MNDLSMFLDKDQEPAKTELDLYEYLHTNAIIQMANTEFGKAATYHENVARALNELQRMKNSKQMNGEAWFILKQIEAKRQQEELLNKMAVNIYE